MNVAEKEARKWADGEDAVYGLPGRTSPQEVDAFAAGYEAGREAARLEVAACLRHLHEDAWPRG